MNTELIINLSYIVAAVLFIYGLKMLSSPATARNGNLLSSLGMMIAVVVTLFHHDIIDYKWIIIGVAIGSIVGALAARIVAMTQMPEMVAIFNGFGGIASLLVGWGAYHAMPESSTFTITTIFLSVLIGGVTFSGSIVAFAKLSEIIGGKPTLFAGQKIVNILLLLAIVTTGVLYIMNPDGQYNMFLVIIGLSLILGIMAVIPIGGADMPVVISLLNSYSGLAACAAGFVIQNNILIVAGALVGASGIILTNIMCKAMNRSLANVLFSGFGSVTATQASKGEQGEVKSISAEDVYYLLEAAGSVAFVPGYGLAVAQAQHVVRELGELL